VAASDWSQLQLPLVFKHHRTGAVVAHTQEEATALVHRLGPELHTFIAQEYIPGRNGFGYFALFQEGREIGYFMHERVMQFPQEGGVSVVARAIRNDRLRDLGRRLLESLAWNGPAMVEFKRSDRDGEFYLIEINPKLWGSLDLAIQAGCNFPVWIANLLCTGKAPQEPAYMEGVTYQWVVPNGLKCFLRYPEFRTQFLSNLTKAKVHTDLRWLDPLPAIAGVLAMTAGLGRK
jgi:predicted ATP-grasp superfamily ATP-dependent carboligase